MVSKRLSIIFLLSLGLIYAHGFEEILTGFQHTDSFIVFGASLFNVTPASFYWISHIAWWLSVPILFLVFRGNVLIFPLLALFGLVFLTEVHHLVKFVLAKSYYPGMLTAFFYPSTGFFFYRELLKNWKYKSGGNQ